MAVAQRSAACHIPPLHITMKEGTVRQRCVYSKAACPTASTHLEAGILPCLPQLMPPLQPSTYLDKCVPLRCAAQLSLHRHALVPPCPKALLQQACLPEVLCSSAAPQLCSSLGGCGSAGQAAPCHQALTQRLHALRTGGSYGCPGAIARRCCCHKSCTRCKCWRWCSHTVHAAWLWVCQDAGALWLGPAGREHACRAAGRLRRVPHLGIFAVHAAGWRAGLAGQPWGPGRLRCHRICRLWVCRAGKGGGGGLESRRRPCWLSRRRCWHSHTQQHAVRPPS